MTFDYNEHVFWLELLIIPKLGNVTKAVMYQKQDSKLNRNMHKNTGIVQITFGQQIYGSTELRLTDIELGCNQYTKKCISDTSQS